MMSLDMEVRMFSGVVSLLARLEASHHLVSEHGSRRQALVNTV